MMLSASLHHTSRITSILARQSSSARCSLRRAYSQTISLASESRGYNDAIEALNSLQSSYAVIQARKAANCKPDARSQQEMHTYFARLGHSIADLRRLNIVHVAGTKGKGSTCAYVDSMLAAWQRTHGSPQRTGLLTSPHLISVRERIRLDSQPISEALFARYFFEVWDRLGRAAAEVGGDGNAGDLNTRPNYARYLTLLAYHVFLQEGVDVAVLETGIGGEYDATNLVPEPAVTGISMLGIDHVFVLGGTIDKIAWHKAGIMKTGSPSFSVPQVPIAETVLRSRAQEKDVGLSFVAQDPRLATVNIRPDADFQRMNASLAVKLTETVLRKIDAGFESKTKPGALPAEFVDGLESVVWKGRCQIKEEEKVRWHFDGAHTIDSINVCSQWFAQECSKQNIGGPKILIFNQQDRKEAVDFLDAMYKVVTKNKVNFDHVVFCTNVIENPAKKDLVNNQVDVQGVKALTVQNTLAAKWRQIDPSVTVSVAPTVNQALNKARNLTKYLGDGEKVQVLVTGSFHLVGAVLSTMS
ncbi:hypothetical protein BROUX41_000759 [Berkeleyomyces rouxiae]|uniref:uncharacterized protein n=1 Tax=Berkeleyomyces rouxiae TaxID=2035830 RepID=UPI003B7FF7AA